RGVDVLRQRGLGDGDQTGEGFGVGDGQLGEVLAVDLHTGGLEALDEAVVGDVVQPRRGVDAGDPQLAEVTLARPAVPVGVGERVQLLFLGLAVQPRALAAVALGGLEDGTALLLSVDGPFAACHWSVRFDRGARAGARVLSDWSASVIGTRERACAAVSDTEQLLHASDVGGRDDLLAVQTTSTARGLVLEQVATVRLLTQQLALAGHLESL